MIAALIGDDKHTARDGNYERLLRTRKWLIISAALLILLRHDLLHLDAAAQILKIASLPGWLVGQVTVGMATYFLFQTFLLLYQAWTARDLLQSERFAVRRTERLELLASLRARLKGAAEEQIALRNEAESWERDASSNPEFARRAEIARTGEKAAGAWLAQAAGQLSDLTLDDPGDRPAYRRAEMLIDGVRLAAPVAALLWALSDFLRHQTLW